MKNIMHLILVRVFGIVLASGTVPSGNGGSF